MTYWQHWRANMWVAGKGLLLAFFHSLHAFIPYEWTSHHYWGIHLGRDK
jgi:hypothetical protein